MIAVPTDWQNVTPQKTSLQKFITHYPPRHSSFCFIVTHLPVFALGARRVPRSRI